MLEIIDVFGYFEQYMEGILHGITPILPFNQIPLGGQDLYLDALTELTNRVDYDLVVISEQLMHLDFNVQLVSYFLWVIMILIFIVVIFNIFKIIVYSLLKLFEY